MEKTSLLFAIAVVIGVVLMVIYWLKKINPTARWLVENGVKIKADFVSFEIDLTVEMNGKNPFVINCRWVDTSTNVSYRFKSNFIWFNPGPLIKDLESLDVYIKQNNPGKYFVDVSFLPGQVTI